MRDALLALGLEAYVPTLRVVRERRQRRFCVEVPAIRNLIFVRASKQAACAAANESGVPLYYLHDPQTRSMLVVPDRQMEDFRRVMALTDPAEVESDETLLEAGRRVMVVEGELCGVEGELVSRDGRSCVRVRIPQILSATVRIPRSYLKIKK